MIWKAVRIFAIGMCAGILWAAIIAAQVAPEQKIDESPRYGGVFLIKCFSDQDHLNLDPSSSEAFIIACEQIYDGLLRLDKDLSLLPGLAEFWKISPDGKRHTFFLRKGVFFHHGKELTAEDVKMSFERILDARVNSPYSQIMLSRVQGAGEYRSGRAEEVSGFRIIDKYTFEIVWTKPFISALYLLTLHFCKILPSDLLEERGDRFFWSPSGTGPFKFDYWRRTPKLEIAGVRLKRNNDYYGGRPYLEGLEICPLYTQDQFIDGAVHSIPVLSERLLKPDYKILKDGSLHLVFLGMSCHLPPLDRQEVREIIVTAIDKKAILMEAYDLKNVYNVINTFIPTNLPGFFPVDQGHMSDPEIARKKMVEQGFGEDSKFPDITLFIEAPRNDIKGKIQRELSKQLRNVNIRLRTRYYRSLSDVREYDRPYLILLEKEMKFPDPEDIVRPLFFSGSILNHLGFKNPQFDNLLRQAEVERSWTKRIELFRSMERLLFKTIPALPLFSYQYRIAVQPFVKDLESSPLGLNYIEAERIWLDRK